MLPSILARQYQEGLIDYIDTSFPITNPIFKGSIRNMLNTKDAVFHDKVITDHETLLAAPPDILMTNYKMLDYLLVRPKDAELWKNNLPDTLKYIAVDELHTFDGAQGTDFGVPS